MSVDVSTCQQIQCGALYQSQVSPDVLLGCAEAGYSSEPQACTSQICSPFMAAMIANGYCQAAPAMIPTATPIYVPLPSATTTAPASIVAAATLPTGNIPPQTLLQPLPQIVPQAQSPVAPQVCDTFSSWVSQNPLWACIGLGIAYLALTHHKW
jgi:hypothetical protein